MIRVGYISGRYTHNNHDGTTDEEAMGFEVINEQYWGRLVAKAGCAVIAPITNSLFLEGDFMHDDFIVRDRAIIRRMYSNYDFILMRPGWDDEPESEGAREEYEEAVENSLLVVYGEQGVEAVEKYLAEITSYKE